MSMNSYIYKTKKFEASNNLNHEEIVARWMNQEGIRAEDIVSITAYCECDLAIPTYIVFYKEDR